MFRNNENNQFIPQKSLIVKPEAQVDYNPRTQNNLRFLVPQFLGFINPADTTLNYKLIMSGKGSPQPSPRAGVHSLWRDLRIRDGTASANLEEIQDYNVLTATWWGYTQNESIANKRNLFEGRQVNPDKQRNVYYNSLNQRWQDGAVTGQTPAQLSIKQPIYSGILSGDKVFPCIATQGLRVEMTLDNIQRSCVYQQGDLGLATETGGVTTGKYLESKGAKIIGADAKTAIDTTFTIDIEAPGASVSGRGVNLNALPFDNNPFSVGDLLHIGTTDALNTSETLGVITGFTTDATKNLVISYIPNRVVAGGLLGAYGAGSAVFVKNLERLNGAVVQNVPQAQIDLALQRVDFTIRDIELHVGVVTPPESYVDSMNSQIKGKGLAMDYKTYGLHRVNLNAVNGLTNQLIPAQTNRGYSVLSVPLSQNNQINIQTDSFEGLTDGCQNYQYVLGGLMIPDRPIDLQRYSINPQYTDALHLIEAEKSLENCGYTVRNLQRVPQRFFIGRAFSKYGQVAELNNRDLSLRVEYSGATQQKLFNHYICHLRRMIIGPNGITVV